MVTQVLSAISPGSGTTALITCVIVIFGRWLVREATVCFLVRSVLMSPRARAERAERILRIVAGEPPQEREPPAERKPPG
jgi:hypothetical protein